MNLYASDSIEYVLRKMAHGRRLLQLDSLSSDSAITYRRYPFGARSLAALFRRVCRLLATPDTIRFLMHEAALKASVDPDRLSSVHALRVLGDALRDFAIAAPEMVPLLYARMLEDIARRPLPPRRARSNPRVVRRKRSNFDLKRPEHCNLPKLKQSFQEAIALI